MLRLCTTLAVSLISGAAFAGGPARVIADPVIAAPVVAAPSWTGGFIGLFGEGGGGTFDLRSEALPGGVGVKAKGTVPGAILGYSWQRGNSVMGLDLSYSGKIEGTSPVGTSGSDWTCLTGECNISLSSVIALRGRYGMLINPQTQIYGAAGLAIAKAEGGIYNSVQQGSSNASGYTLALGTEHRVNRNWSVFGEVSYMDLGDIKLGEGAASDDRFRAKGDITRLRLGVNYRF